MGGSRWPFKKQLQIYDFSVKKQNLTKYFKTGFTLSLVCKPLSFSWMRMKPRFHFGFTSFIKKMERNSRNSHFLLEHKDAKAQSFFRGLNRGYGSRKVVG